MKIRSFQVHRRMDRTRRSRPGNARRVSQTLHHSLLQEHHKTSWSSDEKRRFQRPRTNNHWNPPAPPCLQQFRQGNKITIRRTIETKPKFRSQKVFYGREENLEHIYNYMMDDSDKLLVLYGEGGCGKTSLLAKTASMCTAQEWFKGSRPIIIIRFLGTTPDSSALTPTLISICQQVTFETNKNCFYRSYHPNEFCFRFPIIT